MKATGIVVEYNPFHNGHLHHLQQSRLKTNSDVMIAVMSGNFLQRGEPALVDKWTRTKMALSAGVDLVIELPYAFATAQASDFAKGAIFLLDALKCTSFCFGSEEGSLKAFEHTYDLLTENNTAYNNAISMLMKKGISYPKALNEAYNIISKDVNLPLVDLSKPNNILGYHYIEAAKTLQLEIQPETIQRVIANYHDIANTSETIASATGIRKVLFDKNDLTAVQSFMPSTSLEALHEWQDMAQFFWKLGTILSITSIYYFTSYERNISSICRSDRRYGKCYLECSDN